jgi:site-specific DNA-methyltransferase (adenine-specific)
MTERIQPTWKSDDGTVTLFLGDCLQILPEMEPNSIDSVVTDPPYGLSFMGKEWDHGIPGVHFWSEVLRVAKPGAHLLAFGGTRTFHRLTCAIEDAGWEIRDCLMWVYGSGFPKSLDVSKAIDKAKGCNRSRIPGGVGTDRGYSRGFKPGEAISDEAISDEAITWSGWGTALKPAWEPIILARKPIEGTVIANVHKYGVGGLNIDGCRIASEELIVNHSRSAESAISKGKYGNSTEQRTHQTDGQKLGRFPANLIHDGSEEVMELFPQSDGGAFPDVQNSLGTGSSLRPWQGKVSPGRAMGDSGSAARFFYCAKASQEDREEGLGGQPQYDTELKYNGGDGFAGRTQLADGTWINTDKSNRNKPRNHHPTVKPTALMQYLCRLITPPGGIVLDPFMGSGSTCKAAIKENFQFVGMELEQEYFDIAVRRIEAELNRFPLFQAEAAQ